MLGKLEIELDISGGSVRGTIAVQNVEVAEQLARDLRDLQQGLADSGLELEKDGIQFMLQEDAEQEQQTAEGGNGSDHGDLFDDEDDNEVQEVTWRNPDNLVDVSI